MIVVPTSKITYASYSPIKDPSVFIADCISGNSLIYSTNLVNQIAEIGNKKRANIASKCSRKLSGNDNIVVRVLMQDHIEIWDISSSPILLRDINWSIYGFFGFMELPFQENSLLVPYGDDGSITILDLKVKKH